MILTQEQKKIITSLKSARNIKIKAFAGTGKTFTLNEIAKNYPDKKFLYLAFNKAIQLEALSKFPENTISKTTHSLAFYFVVKKNNYKVENLNAVSLSKEFNIDYNTAYKVLKEFEGYCNSAELSPYGEYNSLVEHLYSKMKKGELAVSHSFYLKEFQLMLLRGEIPPVKKFDVILLDEAQDTNPVTLSIFNNLTAKQKIVVGDKHQQIYAFRGAIDALDKFKADEEYYLTQSFRFNQKIATQANYFLKVFKAERKEIKGISKGEDGITSNAFISRTNGELIDKISFLIENKKSFTFTRHPFDIFGLGLNILKKARGEELDKPFKFLKNIDLNILMQEIESEDFEDFEMKKAIESYVKYGERLKDFYNTSLQYYKNFLNKYSEVDYTLTTAHSSKGLEWDKVVMLEDFNLILSKLAAFFKQKQIKTDDYYSVIKDFAKNNIFNNELVNEFNLFYVAITRAKIKCFNKSNVSYLKDKINLELQSLVT